MSLGLIGLGSNLGDRVANLDRAIDRIARDPDLRLVGQSRKIETIPAVGEAAAGTFMNAALLVETGLSATQLWSRLSGVEQQLGRIREARWGERVIDLDLLLYDRLVMRNAELTVPHPRMAFRRFVLEPAVEIAPDMVHPLIQWTVRQLLDHLATSSRYVALATGDAEISRPLAQAAARQTDARLLDDPVVAEPRRPGSHSRSLRGELESWNLRVRALCEAAGESASWLVSNFWIEQSLVAAQVHLEPVDYQRFESEWEQVPPALMQPRLVVLLGDSSPRDRAAGTEDAGVLHELTGPADSGGPAQRHLTDAASARRERALLWARATRPRLGPWLEVDRADPDWTVREIAAAIQAMS